MRFAVAALCVLALTGSASAGPLKSYSNPCDAKLPATIRHVSVRYQTYNLSQRDLEITCRIPQAETRRVIACTYPINDGTWVVNVRNDLSFDQLTCAINYEMAHMPPNFWADPDMESPEAMARLAKYKADYLKDRTSP